MFKAINIMPIYTSTDASLDLSIWDAALYCLVLYRPANTTTEKIWIKSQN